MVLLSRKTSVLKVICSHHGQLFFFPTRLNQACEIVTPVTQLPITYFGAEIINQSTRGRLQRVTPAFSRKEWSRAH